MKVGYRKMNIDKSIDLIACDENGNETGFRSLPFDEKIHWFTCVAIDLLKGRKEKFVDGQAPLISVEDCQFIDEIGFMLNIIETEAGNMMKRQNSKLQRQKRTPAQHIMNNQIH